MTRDTVYEEQNKSYDEFYEEYGIKCKNYKLCKAILPEWWYDCKGTYLCSDCDMLFGAWGQQTGKGVLDFEDNLECPICLKENQGCVSYPRCDHKVCIPCYKKSFFVDEDEVENQACDLTKCCICRK
tara:strand:+ start:147 stop:527 length:381 start_codon:yes stop_codon:yes gene_type:complete